jgi:hypothetical protein
MAVAVAAGPQATCGILGGVVSSTATSRFREVGLGPPFFSLRFLQHSSRRSDLLVAATQPSAAVVTMSTAASSATIRHRIWHPRRAGVPPRRLRPGRRALHPRAGRLGVAGVRSMSIRPRCPPTRVPGPDGFDARSSSISTTASACRASCRRHARRRRPDPPGLQPRGQSSPGIDRPLVTVAPLPALRRRRGQASRSSAASRRRSAPTASAAASARTSAASSMASRSPTTRPTRRPGSSSTASSGGSRSPTSTSPRSSPIGTRS